MESSATYDGDQVVTFDIPMHPAGSLTLGIDQAGAICGQIRTQENGPIRNARSCFQIPPNDRLEWLFEGVSVLRRHGSVLVMPCNIYVGHVDALELLFALQELKPSRNWIAQT